MPKLYFATDLHGSDICWKKFLGAAAYYKADFLVLGGDMTGKAIVPLVFDGASGTSGSAATATLLDSTYSLEGSAAIADFETKVRSRGYYPVRLTREEREALASDPIALDRRFRSAIVDRLYEWLQLAQERLPADLPCFVCPGNDDPAEVDDVLAQSSRVTNGEGRLLEVGAWQLASTGWSNRTPWHTYREEDESALRERIERILPASIDSRRTIFNFHCPPYASGLDDAPELGADLSIKNAGQSTVPVGSTAVRAAIEHHAPLISMHGHIHEAKGLCRIGKSLVVNPGSLYEQGVLQGVLFDLDPRKGVKSWVMVTG